MRQGFTRRPYAPRQRGGAAQAKGAEASRVESMTLSVKSPMDEVKYRLTWQAWH